LAAFDKVRLRDTIGRPLFAPSRQRPPPVVAAGRPEIKPVGPVKAQPPSYELLGVVQDGNRAIALLRKTGDGASFRVEVGDTIGGWQVSKVEAKSVLLVREDGTSLTVPLYRE
jgi:hypothetical protein